MRFCAILLSVSLTFLAAINISVASDDESVEEEIIRAETIMSDMEKDTSMKKFIPFDTFSDALLYIIYARNQLEEKSFSTASYYATLAMIKLETAAILAQAGKYDYDLIVKEKEYYKNHKEIEPPKDDTFKEPPPKDSLLALIDANLEKIGPVYRTQYLDKYLFDKKYAITGAGKQRLDGVIRILELYPDSTVIVISHSAAYDATNVTKQKSHVIINYFISKGVNEQRLESIGMGNREVMETNLGYKRINRIEIVLKGIVN